jgi:hypothetical protein
MPSDRRHPLLHSARRIPGLRRLPAVELAAVAEVVLLARDHVRLLTPYERRRVAELVREARGRPRNLGEPERQELLALIDKVQPRQFAGAAVDALSPVRLPRRLVYGRNQRRS